MKHGDTESTHKTAEVDGAPSPKSALAFQIAIDWALPFALEAGKKRQHAMSCERGTTVGGWMDESVQGGREYGARFAVKKQRRTDRVTGHERFVAA